MVEQKKDTSKVEPITPGRFIMLHPERPLSLQAKRKRGYMERLKENAKKQWGFALLDGGLYARITWLRRVASPEGDLDNIAKPILDSLVEVVYHDDQRVRQILLNRIDLDETLYTIREDTLPPSVSEELQAWIAAGVDEHCLCVEVGIAAEPAIQGGPIVEAGA